MHTNYINKKQSIFAETLFYIGFVLLYTPIVLVIFNAFCDPSSCDKCYKPSLIWFKALFRNTEILSAIITSLKISTLSATISTLIGFTAATLSTKKKRNKNWLDRSFLSPSLIPDITVGISMLLFFMYTHKYLSWPKQYNITTIVIGHIMSTIAYSYINIKTTLNACDTVIEDAAKDLGASQMQILFKVTLPIIMPSILSCWVFIFTLSLDDLIITSFLSGPGTNTITTIIFSSLRTGIDPVINAFSTLFIFVISCLMIVQLLLKNINTKKTDNKSSYANEQ